MLIEREDGLPYIWPANLRRPQDRTSLVYLDLNHWISLAKTEAGRPDGAPFRQALEELRRGRSAGTVLCPLSATHFMEMGGITDPRQRFAIAELMEELSGLTSLLARDLIMELEFEASFAAMGLERNEPLTVVDLLAEGVGHAFGVRGGLHIVSSSGEDRTAEARERWQGGPKAFDEFKRQSELLLNRSILRGPSDAEVPELEKYGWNPRAAMKIAERRAKQEAEQSVNLHKDADPTDEDPDPRIWRGARLRDVVGARYLALEAKEQFRRVRAARGIDSILEVIKTPEQARNFADQMPSADVWVTLVTARHRARKAWRPNDIFDIDALSVAVPYCDVVVTDKDAAHATVSTSLAKRLGTTVLARLQDLPARLTAG
jgi:hypothetical protein